MMTRRYLDILFLAVIWAVYYIANKMNVMGMSINLIGFLVRTVVFVGLTALLFRSGGIRRLFFLGPITYRILLVGLIGFTLDFAAFWGLRMSTAMNASILLKSDTLFVNLITVIVLRQRIGGKGWLGSFAVLAGALFVMGINPLEMRFTGLGDLLLVMSAFFLAINAFVIRSIQQDQSAEVENGHISWIANVIIWIMFGLLAWQDGSLATTRSILRNPGLIGSLMVAGIAQTLIYAIYYQTLRKYPIWVVKTLLLSTPLFAGLLAILALDEKPHAGLLMGMPLILFGAWLIARPKKDI